MPKLLEARGVPAVGATETDTCRRGVRDEHNENRKAEKEETHRSSDTALEAGTAPAAHSTALKGTRRRKWRRRRRLRSPGTLRLLRRIKKKKSSRPRREGRGGGVGSGGVWLALRLLALLLLRQPAIGAEAAGRQEGGAMAGARVHHPYNEYSWGLNQLNPWLSACDLAGPAPADLQGSCGPPEVPKDCPEACPAEERAGGAADRLFDQVAETLERTRARVVAVMGRKGDDGGPAVVVRGAVKGTPVQCLYYLEESHKRDVCREEFGRSSSRSYPSARDNRYLFISGLRLRHCCEHAALNALAPGKGGPLEAVLAGGPTCVAALDKLLMVDALAARLHCEFGEVLARYDCRQTYSVIHNCTHCKEAYRKWVCSSLVPYFAHRGPLDLEPSEESWTGRRIRACRSLCQSVEQRCPYLLPGDRAPAYPTQYAGEPTFLCQDPNIPETGEQAAKALHPNSGGECCFHVCSEEEPGLGICANCTGRSLDIGPKYEDPPTAPQCDVTSALTGQPLDPTRQMSRCPSKVSTTISQASDPYSAEPFLPTTSASESTTTTTTTTITTTTTTTTTTTPISSSSSATSSLSATSASASSATPSPVPLLCLFWFWGVLFSSQCRLLGLVGLAERGLRLLYASYVHILLPHVPTLFPSLARPDRYFPSRRPRLRQPRLGSFNLLALMPAAVLESRVHVKSAATGLDLTDRASRGCRQHCSCCRYRWWLWPGRWKHTPPRHSRRRRRCNHSSCWNYCRWLWPCRWKPVRALLCAGGRPFGPRKKRRRNERFSAACCRELDLARSTS